MNDHISPRELEVHTLVAYEHRTKETAQSLYHSEHTVLSHSKHLLLKMDVKNTAVRMIGKRSSRILPILVVLLFVQMSQGLVAQHIWVGSTDQDWHEPRNWNKKTVPTANDNVFIDIGDVVFARINQSNRAKAIRNHGTITIDRNASLTVYRSTLDGVECHGEIISEGALHIIKPGGIGIVIKNGGSIENGKTGVINIDTCTTHGIEIEGLLNNDGKLNIDSTGQHGIDNFASGVFENTGDASMHHVGENGINNRGSIVNTGDIDINHTQLNGVINKGQYQNDGNTNIAYAALISLSNTDTLINNINGRLQITLGSQGLYTDYIENRGDIIIEDMDSVGFFHTKDFDNFGKMSIINVKEAAIMMDGNSADRHEFNNMSTGSVYLSFISGDAFILNNHTLTNEGIITVDSTLGSGIITRFNSDPIMNDGIMNISRTGLRAIDGIDTLINGNTGVINLFEITSSTSSMISGDYLMNNGKIVAYDISAGSVIGVHDLINNDSILVYQVDANSIISSSVINETNGYISISSSAGNGLSGTSNKGTIVITDLSEGSGLSASDFINDGKIILNNIQNYGISSDSFINRDTITISGRYGIEISDVFINDSDGYIHSDSATLYVRSGGTALINQGVIRTGGSLSTFNDIINESCGQIYTTGDIYSAAGVARYINKGYTYHNSPSENIGFVFTNSGIYHDIQGSSDYYGVVNEGILLDSIIGSYNCTDNISPILIGPNDSLIAVVGITIDSVGDISAGTFDLSSNTFSPNSSVGNISKLYIQFLMPSGCITSVPLFFEEPIICEGCQVNIWTGDANTTDWFAPDNWSLDIIPLSNHDVRIPDGAVVHIATGLVGTSKLLEVPANVDFTVDGSLEVVGQ